MIRPKVRAIESQGPTRKWHDRDVFNLRLFLSRIEPRDRPGLAVLFGAAQDVDHPINKRVARDLRTDIDNADDIATRAQLKNAMFVPLTQIDTLAVVTEILTRKFRASDFVLLGKANLGSESANVAIIVRAFPNCKTKLPI